MAKQINWGYQFKRNFRGPIDPDSVFKTYDEMTESPYIYNGAIVTVTDDANEVRNGIYFIVGNDNTGVYAFYRGTSSNEEVGLPFLLTFSTEVVEVTYQGDTNNYKVVLRDNKFVNLDIIGWHFADDLSTGTYSKVEYSVEDAIYIGPGSKRPNPGDFIYQIGNTVDESRASLPVIFLKEGSGTYTVFLNTDINNINKERHTYIGKDNVGKPVLYSMNAYLKGIFLDESGTDLGDAVKKLSQELRTGFNDVREELSSKNRVSNPFFLEKMNGWTTVNDAQFFKTLNGKWLWNTNTSKVQKGLYALKRKGAYIETFDSKVCLSLQEGKILQTVEDLRQIVSDTTESFPKLMDITFMYYVTSPGTLRVSLGNTHTVFENMAKSEKWAQIRVQMEWNGLDSFELDFRSDKEVYGEIKIRAVYFQENELGTFKEKYSELLRYSDVLVEIAKERTNQLNDTI